MNQQSPKRVGQIINRITSVIDGKPETVETALTVLLAEGHLLIEDVPGVGKTVLAKTLGRTLGCTVKRIQFTPDLLPSDITGVAAFNRQRDAFEFIPGAVFANIVIGDEINRAPAKTQSALLEAMEERQVTVDGRSYELEQPFTVIATQNPFELEGTYVLPEAQRDRFMACISMGYPDEDAERLMIRQRDRVNPLDTVEAVVTIDEVKELIVQARAVYISDAVQEYCVTLVRATREDPTIKLGASPRATLHLVRAAKARAFIHGRDFVTPDDIDALVLPVLAHRIVPMDNSSTPSMTLHRIVEVTPVPDGVKG